MSKIGSPVFGNSFQDFEHEIVEENSEFSHLKSDKDMSRAEMEEIEEEAQEENYDSMRWLPIWTWLKRIG